MTFGTFQKKEDSEQDIDKLIKELDKELDKNGRVLISMIIPTGRYESNKLNRHEGHTFAISRETNNIIVFDTHEEQYNGNIQKIVC